MVTPEMIEAGSAVPFDANRSHQDYVESVYEAMRPLEPKQEPVIGEFDSAISDIQYMWDMLSKNGTNPVLMQRFSKALTFIESCRKAEPTFQDRVQPWMMECFGAEIASDKQERSHRFIEEALELVQACGTTTHEAHQLVDYVFNRPVGEKHQEVGGVMVTLAALCLAHDLDMHENGETELARVWTKIEKIRAKQAAKPKHSPLPEQPKPPVPSVPDTDALDAKRYRWLRDNPWGDSLREIISFHANSKWDAAIDAARKAEPLEPHPPHRQCGCPDCVPSFEAERVIANEELLDQIQSMQETIDRLTERAEYAVTNCQVIENARQEEMRKRDAAQKELAAIRQDGILKEQHSPCYYDTDRNKPLPTAPHPTNEERN